MIKTTRVLPVEEYLDFKHWLAHWLADVEIDWDSASHPTVSGTMLLAVYGPHFHWFALDCGRNPALFDPAFFSRSIDARFFEVDFRTETCVELGSKEAAWDRMHQFPWEPRARFIPSTIVAGALLVCRRSDDATKYPEIAPAIDQDPVEELKEWKLVFEVSLNDFMVEFCSIALSHYETMLSEKIEFDTASRTISAALARARHSA